MKNEYTKQILRATGVRKASLEQKKTPHYRMPMLEQAGGWMRLDKYKGPEIPASEWEDLTYTTYSSDPTTYFAPITSATGEIELKGFWEYGKADLDGVWTSNAEKCPSIVKWVESIGARFGRVQLLRMSANTMREYRWGLHLDNNNQGNPENQGWVVRVWLELTDDAVERARRPSDGVRPQGRGQDRAAQIPAGGRRLRAPVARRAPRPPITCGTP